MEQYLPKSVLVAEIERLKADVLQKKGQCKRSGLEKIMHQIGAYNKILSFLDTLKVKDLQEEPVSVWHDANQQPTMFRKYLVRYSDGRVSGSWERHDDGLIPWKDVVKEHGFTHWCYVEDLLKL